jgi:hypothetical protein
MPWAPPIPAVPPKLLEPNHCGVCLFVPVGPEPPDGGGSFVVFVPVLGVGDGVGGMPVGFVLLVVDIAILLGLDRYRVGL